MFPLRAALISAWDPQVFLGAGSDHIGIGDEGPDGNSGPLDVPKITHTVRSHRWRAYKFDVAISGLCSSPFVLLARRVFMSWMATTAWRQWPVRGRPSTRRSSPGPGNSCRQRGWVGILAMPHGRQTCPGVSPAAICSRSLPIFARTHCCRC